MLAELGLTVTYMIMTYPSYFYISKVILQKRERTWGAADNGEIKS